MLASQKKFGIDLSVCNIDGGIQKYLDGYEISPHPDIRRKAATFMVNINPSKESENIDYHTHYLKFSKERKYVQSYWEGNQHIDRCWVPWSWCETEKRQTKNNSIVIFSPSDDSVHAVKANYRHLETQRTQLYGNLWYSESKVDGRIEWEGLDLDRNVSKTNIGKQKPIKKVFSKVKQAIKSRRDSDVGTRKY